MNRYAYKDPIPRCTTVSPKTKKRCTRDATHFHAGKNYCDQHHTKLLQEKRDDQAQHHQD